MRGGGRLLSGGRRGAQFTLREAALDGTCSAFVQPNQLISLSVLSRHSQQSQRLILTSGRRADQQEEGEQGELHWHDALHFEKCAAQGYLSALSKAAWDCSENSFFKLKRALLRNCCPGVPGRHAVTTFYPGSTACPELRASVGLMTALSGCARVLLACQSVRHSTAHSWIIATGTH